MRGRIPIVAVLVFYSSSLCMPAATVDLFGGGPDTIVGYEALLHGWMGAGVVAEFANVALVAGFIALMLRYTTVAATCGVLAIACGLSAPKVFSVPLERLHAGYYLWMLSFVILAVGGLTDLKGDVTRTDPAQSTM